ncbi:MAG: hypothetical protein BWX86_02353 [Verrucomicrobia bacterium ADurb.Bin122]|nr:MAG: hypothetical protein BWX86_02353 [Verrucomicrobia bacterium ADurb.Bin122]
MAVEKPAGDRLARRTPQWRGPADRQHLGQLGRARRQHLRPQRQARKDRAAGDAPGARQRGDGRRGAAIDHDHVAPRKKSAGPHGGREPVRAQFLGTPVADLQPVVGGGGKQLRRATPRRLNLAHKSLGECRHDGAQRHRVERSAHPVDHEFLKPVRLRRLADGHAKTPADARARADAAEERRVADVEDERAHACGANWSRMSAAAASIAAASATVPEIGCGVPSAER